MVSYDNRLSSRREPTLQVVPVLYKREVLGRMDSGFGRTMGGGTLLFLCVFDVYIYFIKRRLLSVGSSKE